MSTLKFTSADLWSQIETHFKQAHGERFAFGFTRLLHNSAAGPVVEVVDVHLVPDEDVQHDRTGWYLSETALDRVHNHALRAGLGIAEFHNHGPGHAAFSRTDERGLAPMAQYVLDLLPGRPYVAGVWAAGQVHVEWWRAGREPVGGAGPQPGAPVERRGFDTMSICGDRLAVPNAVRRPDPRMGRQEKLLTGEGQAALGALRIAVVGAGGTGSHMLVQLAYLGARNFVILDDDLLEETNLNRVVTAGHDDVGTAKTTLADRRIKDVDPCAHVRTYPGLSVEGEHPELRDVDLIIGCVDHDGPRHRLMQIALETRTPYLDVATGVDDDSTPAQVGGRVILCAPSGPCLNCLGELDPQEVGRWGKSTEQQELDRAHGYGTNEPSPSVVFLNGLVVSAAIGELVAWVSGARPPATYLDIDIVGMAKTPGIQVAPRKVAPQDPDCLECG